MGEGPPRSIRGYSLGEAVSIVPVADRLRRKKNRRSRERGVRQRRYIGVSNFRGNTGSRRR